MATLERHTAHQPPLCTTLPDHAGRRPGPAHRAEEGGGGGDHGATPPISALFRHFLDAARLHYQDGNSRRTVLTRAEEVATMERPGSRMRVSPVDATRSRTVSIRSCGDGSTSPLQHTIGLPLRTQIPMNRRGGRRSCGVATPCRSGPAATAAPSPLRRIAERTIR